MRTVFETFYRSVSKTIAAEYFLGNYPTYYNKRPAGAHIFAKIEFTNDFEKNNLARFALKTLCCSLTDRPFRQTFLRFVFLGDHEKNENENRAGDGRHTSEEKKKMY